VPKIVTFAISFEACPRELWGAAAHALRGSKAFLAAQPVNGNAGVDNDRQRLHGRPTDSRANVRAPFHICNLRALPRKPA
jgi:hypothetical protein